MKLYYASISPNAKRIRVCAAELGIPLEAVQLDVGKGETRAPEYLALNPMGRVPTVTDDSFVLWESPAILWYMATKHGAQQLLPKELRAEADTLRWLFFCASHIDSHLTVLMQERFIKARRKLESDPALIAAAEKELARFVPVLEQQLATHEYVTGQFSIADIALGCSMELSPALGFDLTKYPHIAAWLTRLHARPSWNVG